MEKGNRRVKRGGKEKLTLLRITLPNSQPIRTRRMRHTRTRIMLIIATPRRRRREIRKRIRTNGKRTSGIACGGYWFCCCSA